MSKLIEMRNGTLFNKILDNPDHVLYMNIINRIIHGLEPLEAHLQNNRTHYLCYCPGLCKNLYLYLITCLLYFCLKDIGSIFLKSTFT